MIGHVESGLSVTDACKIVPLARSAFYSYLRAHDHKKPALKKATEVRDLAIAEEAKAAIRSAFGKDWKSAAWWLERNFPHLFGMNPLLRTGEEKKKKPEVSEARIAELLDDPGILEMLVEMAQKNGGKRAN